MSDEFDILRAAAAGMDAQRSALDLAARNVAAAEADGTTFERLIPRYALGGAPDAGIPDEPPDVPDDGASGDGDASDASDLPIRFLGATAQRGAEVDAVTEMVSVLDAQRAYDANASVFDTSRKLSHKGGSEQRLR